MFDPMDLAASILFYPFPIQVSRNSLFVAGPISRLLQAESEKFLVYSVVQQRRKETISGLEGRIKRWQEIFGRVHTGISFFWMFSDNFQSYAVYFSQQWLLDRQDILRERGNDLKNLTEEEYQKLMIFFANCTTSLMAFFQSGMKIFSFRYSSNR